MPRIPTAVAADLTTAIPTSVPLREASEAKGSFFKSGSKDLPRAQMKRLRTLWMTANTEIELLASEGALICLDLRKSSQALKK